MADKPFIIPIFLPHQGCPHHCIFCNQNVITGVESPLSINSIHKEIEQFLQFRTNKRTETQISFYGGNFLGLNESYLIDLLTIAQSYIHSGQIHSIRFSTRPDTITKDRLSLLKQFSVKTIELGVQSMDDCVLNTIKRGHSANDTIQAMELLSGKGYQLGIQLMVGLPGDNQKRLLESSQQVVQLKPNFVRIYPVLVLKQSPLAKWYKEGKYNPLTLEKAVQKTKSLYLLFHSHGIHVIRMGLQIAKSDQNSIIAGPYHPAFGHMVYSDIVFDSIIQSLTPNHKIDQITIHTHPNNLSLVKGINNYNVNRITKKISCQSCIIQSDPKLSLQMIMIQWNKSLPIYLKRQW